MDIQVAAFITVRWKKYVADKHKAVVKVVLHCGCGASSKADFLIEGGVRCEACGKVFGFAKDSRIELVPLSPASALRRAHVERRKAELAA